MGWLGWPRGWPWTISRSVQARSSPLELRRRSRIIGVGPQLLSPGRGPTPVPSALRLLDRLVEVLDGLVDRDLGRGGGLLQVVVGDVRGVAVIRVRLPATTRQAHTTLLFYR